MALKMRPQRREEYGPGAKVLTLWCRRLEQRSKWSKIPGILGVGGACHARVVSFWRAPIEAGLGGHVGICVKWMSMSEDLEPVCVGIDIDAEPGKRNIGRALHQSE